ncbi:MAG: Holliday junction branch migration protein RuvA [Clostridia bacterium]|nr:Holliday junction branch migration protein RuvA [Clostridia bacterium]
MIAFVRGRLSAIEDDCLIIDNNGIGLTVFAPLAMIDPRPAVGDELFLHTYLQVREDSWNLFGFSQKEQLKTFKLLIGVSGVGAKTALAVLNVLAVGTIAAAVSSNDYNVFCAVPGVGKKTAQRLTLELKDKITFAEDSLSAEDFGATKAVSSADNDVLAALLQLGFSATEARSLVIKAQQSLPEGSDNETLLMSAIRLSARS